MTSSWFTDPAELLNGLRKVQNSDPAESAPQIDGFTDYVELARGGQGVVYSALQESTRRRVAIKLPLDRSVGDRAATRRFEREIDMVARLRHPNIVRIYDSGMTRDGRLYYVMEFIEGRTLREHLDQTSPTCEERVALFHAIADALNHAHQRGVIHRDLKPSNIRVDANGQPHVLDFGLAKVNEEEVELTVTEGVGGFLGSLPWASPEQVTEGQDDVDVRTDVYSMGVLMYWAVTGQHPYDVAGPVREALTAIVESIPRSPRALDATIPPDLETIILKCLAKEKSRRFQSAGELAEDLRRLRANEPVLARGDSGWYTLQRSLRRYRTALIVGIVFLVSLAVYAVTTSLLYDQASERLAEIRLLSDAIEVRDLIAEQDGLWPRREGMLPALDAWLARAEVVVERRERHEAAWAGVRAEVIQQQERAGLLTPGTEAEPIWEKATVEQRFRHETADQLVRRHDELLAHVAEVRARRALAETIRQRTVDDHAEDWEDAIFFIGESETYDGLELTPQVGLIPIGPDPQSGLWEFWLFETGERPTRDDDTEEILVTGATGVVLVLIPGGAHWMGSQMDNPRAPYYDRLHVMHEVLHEVTLGPFFVSKYELTQGQWERIMGPGSNPSFYQEGEMALDSDWPAHPVEQVSWHDCTAALARVGLQLPTEAQWEAVARAGSTTPWWTGAEKETLEGNENLGDQAFGRNDTAQIKAEDWDDGYPVHAPVGSFTPNDFGLYDVSGNVTEWCRSWAMDYGLGHRPGDGEFLNEELTEGELNRRKIFRGGDYYSSSVRSRSAFRGGRAPEFHNATLGCRPARVLE